MRALHIIAPLAALLLSACSMQAADVPLPAQQNVAVENPESPQEAIDTMSAYEPDPMPELSEQSVLDMCVEITIARNATRNPFDSEPAATLEQCVSGTPA